MSIYFFIKISLLMTCLAAQYEALFESRRPSEDVDRIRLYLEDNEQILVPDRASVKIIRHRVAPEIPGPLLEANYKPRKKPKYPKRPNFGKFLDDAAFDELFKSSVEGGATRIHGEPQFDDVKPVNEHIENDYKYDFRTKTHSY